MSLGIVILIQWLEQRIKWRLVLNSGVTLVCDAGTSGATNFDTKRVVEKNRHLIKGIKIRAIESLTKDIGIKDGRNRQKGGSEL